MSWEAGEGPRRWTRRQWVKLAMAAGTVGTVGALSGTVAGQLLPPPVRFSGTLHEELYYAATDAPQWWYPRLWQPVRTADLKLWQGAVAVWRGLFDSQGYIPGTGMNVLVIRVPRDDAVFRAPTDPPLPAGFSLHYDDAATDTRIVVVLDRCVHLCCPPGWHYAVDLAPDRAYVHPAPTYQVYGQDPILCKCHGSQYDPMLLVWDVNPRNGVRYVGAEFVHGPAQRALPVVPVASRGGVLVGGMGDPRWYDYCG